MASVLSIDPSRPLALLSSACESNRSERHRTLLDVVHRHIKAEIIDLDLDAVMATLIQEPYYRFNGLASPTPEVRGRKAVEALYLASFEGGANASALDLDRIIVDDSNVVLQGRTQAYGIRVAALYPELRDQIDLSRPSIASKRVAIILPFHGDLMTGEEMYFDGPYTPADFTIL